MICFKHQLQSYYPTYAQWISQDAFGEHKKQFLKVSKTWQNLLQTAHCWIVKTQCSRLMVEEPFLDSLLLCTFFSKLGVNFLHVMFIKLSFQILFFSKVALNLDTNILHGVWIEQNCAFSFFWCAKSCTMITLCSSLHPQEIVSNSFF